MWRGKAPARKAETDGHQGRRPQWQDARTPRRDRDQPCAAEFQPWPNQIRHGRAQAQARGGHQARCDARQQSGPAFRCVAEPLGRGIRAAPEGGRGRQGAGGRAAGQGTRGDRSTRRRTRTPARREGCRRTRGPRARDRRTARRGGRGRGRRRGKPGERQAQGRTTRDRDAARSRRGPGPGGTGGGRAAGGAEEGRRPRRAGRGQAGAAEGRRRPSPFRQADHRARHQRGGSPAQPRGHAPPSGTRQAPDDGPGRRAREGRARRAGARRDHRAGTRQPHGRTGRRRGQVPDAERHHGHPERDDRRRDRHADRRGIRPQGQPRLRGGRGGRDRPGCRGRRGQARRAAGGGDDHGPCRPRQDLAAGRDPQDQRGLRGSGRHHPAHRRLSGEDTGRRDDHLPRHARPRGLHLDARPRRSGDRHRRAGGGRRRQRDAADHRGDQPRQGGRACR